MSGIIRWQRIVIPFLIWGALMSGNLAVAQTEKAFTLSELAKYNGQNGAPAYVAVNGVVYDLTKVPEWKGGRHFCAQAVAGKDISFLWNLVPPSHKDPKFLTRFTVVGKIVAAKPPSATPSPTASQSGKEKLFTPQQLAKYNGQNGAPAYVAVNGIVYDLTKVPEWKGGRHFCAQAVAGRDISLLWNLVPRSHKKPHFLDRFPVAGRLAAAAVSPSATAPRGASGGTPNLGTTLLIGLGIALIISFGWLIFSLRRKKIK